MKQLAAGIDIGGTNTVIGLVDAEGNIFFKDTIPTARYEKPEEFVQKVSEIIITAVGENTKLLGIGIGAPNGNFYKGTIEFAPNLRWKGVIPLVSFFEKYFSVPVILTNDANAAAIGEMIYGNARGMKHFIEITLGTGVGSGIVVDGNMVYGHDGFAGEIGHAIVFPGGRPCGCGRNGCLEAYCSAKGIVKTFAELKEKNRENVPQNINPKQIAELAYQGDSIAKEAYRITGEILGLALANSVAHTSPEAIFLFGGIAQAGDILFEPTKKSFEENLLVVFKNKIRILPSGLNENDAAILGAASLIWKEIHSEQSLNKTP